MKLAVVIPWFGRELKGGAEQHAWQLAVRLAARGHTIDVLTTCCRSHQDDWETNHLAEGTAREPEGFTVCRFTVNRRKRADFDRVCAALLKLNHAQLRVGVSPVSRHDSQIFANELIKSEGLLSYIDQHRDHYDRFIFLPYLYGPTIAGVELLGPRAVLLPCLHDEAYAYLPEVAQTFYAAGSILFISEGEQGLAYRLYGPALAFKSTLAGAGVETSPPPAARDKNRLKKAAEKYVLYLGRKDPGKNTDLLTRAFSRFRQVRPNSTLRLVLAGHGTVERNGCGDWIVDLGLVTNEKKEQLLNHCLAVAQPSANESFSRVMMEAWLHGKPVAVHGNCLATAVATRNAKSGWLAESEDEWAAWFVELDRATPVDLRELGENGRQHAQIAADWERVIDRYEKALSAVAPGAGVTTTRSNGETINQFLPNLSHGDAISNEAIFIRGDLRQLGYQSEIYVRYIDPRVADQCHAFSVEALQASNAAIYHHSIGSEITPHLVSFSGPKCLIYHNITPAEFFLKFRPQFAEILRQGRDELRILAPHFRQSYGDSAYNAEELARLGFHDPQVLPLSVAPDKWAFLPDAELMQTLADGRTNILFVGRIAPNKKQDDLLEAFAHFRILDPDSRLILAGTMEEQDPYVTYLREKISHLGLAEAVLLTGSVTESKLAAYYRTAHLFWSMSEHEGFCVPLIEAMWFDVPVFAFRSSAVPETLGEAALMFNDKKELPELAGLAYLVAHDAALRERIIKAQRERRLRFLPNEVKPQLHRLRDNLLARAKARR